MTTRRFTLLCLALGSLQLLGCANRDLTRSFSSAPLAQVIKPSADSRQLTEKSPLVLPSTVAIVTVPSKNGRIPSTTLRQSAEKLKQQLLACPKYVSSVSVVPEDETKDRISLEEIRRGYGADIAILLSYQQDQRNMQSGAAGMMDAAIVGMFLVPGVEIKTSSIIDGRVIHIPNNAIIFRASGTDERSSHSTSYAEGGNSKEESINGIVAATADFGNALIKTLTKFDNYDFSQAVPLSTLAAGGEAESKGKPANDYWKHVDSYKSSGGGAFGIIPLMFAGVLCLFARRRR